MPVAPDNERIIVIVPLNPEIVFVGVRVPILVPVVGTVPEPTAMPFTVIDQFWAPVVLRCCQKLNELNDKEYPFATVNVSVIVGVPLELLKPIACPADPA